MSDLEKTSTRVQSQYKLGGERPVQVQGQYKVKGQYKASTKSIQGTVKGQYKASTEASTRQ